MLHAGFPHLCQVAIVGHPPPDEDAPGRDLLLDPVRHLGHDEGNEEDETAFVWEGRRSPTRGEDKP
jgi:hypothetical protein